MRSIVRAPKMRHAINARIRSASALAAVRIEFLLRQDVAASLEGWGFISASICIDTQSD